MSYAMRRGGVTLKKSRSRSVDVNSYPSVSDLPVLRRKRTLSSNRLRKTFEIAQLAKCDSSHLHEFLAHYSALKKQADDFEKAHLSILGLVDESDAEDEDMIRSDFDEIYFKVIAIHQSLVTSSSAHDQSQHQTASTIKLPKIELPKFSGNIKEWPTFYDTFNSLIHSNRSLSNSERMHYLRSSLTHDASQLIKAFPIQGVYYEEAYKTLVNRYRNKRELAFTCWKEMLNINFKINAPVEFRRALDLFNENLTILKGLDLPTDQWDFVLCYQVLSRLDSKTRCAFEQSDKTSELPCYKTLIDFLEIQCDAFVRDKHFSGPSVSNPPLSNSATHTHTHSYKSKVASTLLADNTEDDLHINQASVSIHKSIQNRTASVAPPVKCVYCLQDHAITHCKTFAEKNAHDRRDYAQTNRWCFNCLKPSHSVRDCKSIFTCQKCRQRHHTLLHQEADSDSGPTPPMKENVLTNIAGNSVVLLSTAIIDVLDVSRNFQPLRALIDTGSQAHFITEHAAHRLGLNKQSTSRQVRGVGQSATTISGAVQLQLGLNGQVRFHIEALTIPNICGQMPSVTLDCSSWQHIRGLNLADPGCDTPGPIDILLGAEIFPSLILPGSIHGGLKQPSALNSVFGWLLLGTVGDRQNNIAEPQNYIADSFLVSNDQLFQEVKKFWELDCVSPVTKMTAEDQRCEHIYCDTTTRTSTGRFVVALPLKEEELPRFPGSRESALKRFYSLERKLRSDTGLREQYSNFMSDYLQHGHMTPVPAKELSQGRYYIPHHCVLRPDSTTTKLRVVFDASAPDNEGKSLNDTLLTGPKLQANILEILLRFRIQPIVLCADVCQMYRQFWICEDHRDFQRIFWRADHTEPILEYRLNTVTYGISSAPFLACRTMKALADEAVDLPLAQTILSKSVYVDDVVASFTDVKQAKQGKTEIVELLRRGGLELRKWASNSPEVLSDLPSDHCLTDPVSMDVEKTAILKVLGLKWEPCSDSFTFAVAPQDQPCTKRNILSELARIFDPLGFLSPLTFIAKYLVQQLWVIGISWDDEPPDNIKRQWATYIEELSCIQDLRIPRFISSPQLKSCELHGFADSSERGYGGVIYLRVLNDLGNAQVFFICSKGRVAPLKVVSLPRLELCAAVLLADLLKYALDVYRSTLPISDIFAWSDSTVTLSWIRSPSSRWKTFVANRVSHIQDAIPGAHWRHVPTADNPADIASRGQSPAELVHNSLWWAGPAWLCQPRESWPSPLTNHPGPDFHVEEKLPQVLLTSDTQPHPVDMLLERCSSIRQVQRIVASWLRFIHNLRHKDNRRFKLPLNRSELHNALLLIVKRTQSVAFSAEMKQLRDGKLISKHMRRLNPFIDKAGVLRVGGRLSRSGLEYSHMHPALLPQSAPLSYMIIEALHRENCHPGINTLSYLLSQQFWILSAKRAIRHCVSKCLKCFKTKPQPLEPFMSDLPAVRVNQVKAFSMVGVDYAGPFRLKTAKHRGARLTKAYLCLFVCLATKAVHLEVAADLTSDAFIAALRRLVGRRGRVSTIHSDRGTNFVGAHRELSLLMQTASCTEQIEFKFNPPASPHFGGVWEIQIKAVKTHLYRTIGDQSLSLDEMFTVFIQIEAMLNSRPLYPISSDPNDFAVLTPGHFLTLEPLTAVPDEDLTSINVSRLGRWQLIQRFQQDFWKRWKAEYLHSLTQRAKWTKQSKPLNVGSVVLIKSDSPPLHWPLARVENLHPGPDGVVRVATLRLPNSSILVRPLTKVCPLPTQSD